MIEFNDGSKEIRKGGSRSWRNSNPGNLINSAFSVRHGSLGETGGFAVFPSEEAGHDALLALLRGPTFQSLTLNGALARYAPPEENDTDSYQSFVRNRLGVPGDIAMGDLSQSQIEELASLIKEFEGWSVGQIMRKEGD